MGRYVHIEIVRCANPSACKEENIVVSDPEAGGGTRLTGSCGGPHRVWKVWLVKREELLRALGVAEGRA